MDKKKKYERPRLRRVSNPEEVPAQFSFTEIRSLQEKIKHLQQRRRTFEDHEEIRRLKEKLFDLCKNREDAATFLKSYPDLFVRLIEKTPRTKTRQKAVPTRKDLLPCQPGTSWEDCRITLNSEETVRIGEQKNE